MPPRHSAMGKICRARKKLFTWRAIGVLGKIKSLAHVPLAPMGYATT
jgi:hypothetical protein